jgi:hypothetical protein
VKPGKLLLSAAAEMVKEFYVCDESAGSCQTVKIMLLLT